MKFNGIELVEMVPENWNGKTRKMLVWCNGDVATPKEQIVCGYDPIHCVWLAIETQDTVTPEVWKTPKVWKHCAEIPEETYITNNLTEEEIIEKFKTLRSELKQWLKNNDFRNLLVNNLQYGIKTALNLTHANHHFIDVVDFSKIDTNEKKTRRMTYRELSHWCAIGNGEWSAPSIDVTVYQRFDYDVEREAEEVSEHIKIRSWDETEWREPLIEE